MKILITGITGRIGATLARRLASEGHTLRGLVWPQDRQTGRLADLPVEWVEGSLTQAVDCLRAVDGVEAIYHLGAAFQAGGPFTRDDYFEINVRGTFNMLEAALAQEGLAHFAFASSDALYDKYLPGGMTAPIREDETPLAPGGDYALSKLLGEDLVRGYGRSHGLPVTIFRFAMTIGGAEPLTWGQFYARHWLGVYARKTSAPALAIREQLAAALDKDAETLVLARDEHGRSYKKHVAYAEDITAGLAALPGRSQAVGATIQLAGPQAFTWEEAIPYLAQKLGRPFLDLRLVEQIPTYYEFDLTRSRELLDFAPGYSIQRMIDTALEFTG